MSDIRNHIESMLNNYTTMVRELKVLEFEMESITSPLDPEVIENIMLSHSNGERISGSFRSDKTAGIVIEHVDRQRNAKYHALKNLIYNMRQEVRRLEHTLSLLPKEESNVMKWFYFEGLSWAAIAKKTALTVRTMQRRKKRGLDKLVNCYSVVDKLSAQANDIRMKARFIGYVHEERCVQCLKRLKKEHRNPGLDAMLYIISGCNELWNAGPDSFVSFETGKPVPQESITGAFSEQGAKLLRLAYCYAHGLTLDRLPAVLNSYFSGLEHIHLELAMEGMRLALFPK